MASIELRSIGGSMAERKRKSAFRKWVNEWADEGAGIATLWGGTELTKTIRDIHSDTRKAYRRNLKYRKSKQLTFKGRRGVVTHNKKEAQAVRNLIDKNFKVRGKHTKYDFFPRTIKTIRAIRNPFRGAKGIDKELLKTLTISNKRSLKKILKNYSRKGLITGAVTFGAYPIARALQADYTPKRKFKKTLRRNVSRGIVQPVYGYAGGSALDQALTRYPYLRGSKKIRSLEGRFSQKYGQGVQFYKGTSGMRAEEIAKLDRDLARIEEMRRRAKRRRGK